MSYKVLADDLDDLARRLRSRAEALEGIALAKAADRLSAAVKRFSKSLDTALRGIDPEVAALRELLESQQARAALEPKSLKALAKKATGKALTVRATDPPQAQRRKLLDAALKRDKVHKTLEALRTYLTDVARPAPDPADRDKVLAEVWRLGSLGDIDLEIEKMRLLENDPLVRAMADFTAIRTTARSSTKSILTRVIKFARRVEENVS